MPRRWLKHRLPDAAAIRQWLGSGPDGPRRRLALALAHPALWHLNRRTVAGAVAIGLFVGWLPIPFQMVVAASIAMHLHVHVPVAVVTVWFSNPLTVGPLLYAAWWVGSIATGRAVAVEPVVFSLESLVGAAMAHWPAVLLGCLLLGAASAVVGFLLTHWAWRVAVTRERRRSRRLAGCRTRRAAPTSRLTPPVDPR